MKKIAVVFKKNIKAWLLMFPSILLFGFYIWMPLIQNVSLSFYNTIGADRWVGLAQYQEIFKDADFLKALGNTFEYTLWSIIIGFLVPIVLALLLNEIVHFRGFFRTILYIPNIIPGIAVAILWAFLFDPNPYGVLNSLFDSDFLWLNNEHAVIPLIVLTMTWKSAGATALIYLAALQGIDPMYYEAARIEGASAWNRFRYVTVPYLLEQIKVLFILQIISVFQVFYEPLVMTKGGGPSGESSSLVQLIFQTAFENMNFGKAAAMSVVVAILLFGLTGIYFLLNRKRRDF